MKNLNEVAARYNLFTFDNIPNGWDKSRISSDTKSIPDYLLKCDLIEIDLFWECRIQDPGTDRELKYIEHGRILLKSKNNEILLRLAGNDYQNPNKYWFHTDYSFEHKQITLQETERGSHIVLYHTLRTTATKNLSEPNKIGVFTDKKVNQWLEYCENYNNAIETKVSETKAQNQAHRDYIESVISSLSTKTVTKSKDENRIWIKTPLFEINFELDVSQAYLKKELRFNGKIEDIIKLSNLS